MDNLLSFELLSELKEKQMLDLNNNNSIQNCIDILTNAVSILEMAKERNIVLKKYCNK